MRCFQSLLLILTNLDSLKAPKKQWFPIGICFFSRGPPLCWFQGGKHFINQSSLICGVELFSPSLFQRKQAHKCEHNVSNWSEYAEIPYLLKLGKRSYIVYIYTYMYSQIVKGLHPGNAKMHVHKNGQKHQKTITQTQTPLVSNLSTRHVLETYRRAIVF